MNILDLLNNSLFQWLIGIVIGIVIYQYILKQIINIVHNSVVKLNLELQKIKDDTVRQICYDVVRNIAQTMPNVDGSKKLQVAIKLVQELTPDIILSDNKVKVFIESAYNELKEELSKI